MTSTDYKHFPRDYNIITCQSVGKAQFNLPKIQKLGSNRKPNIDKRSYNQKSHIEFYDIQKEQNRFPFENVYRQMNLQKPYESGLESHNFWGPSLQYNITTLMNSSSKDYNFIYNTKIKNPLTIQNLRKIEKITNKKKSIAEYADLGRLMSPNINPDFQALLKNKSDVFRRYKGMCSTACKIAKEYGADKPFRRFKYQP